MTTYLYRPGHPHANDRGFVEANDFYYHKFLTEPDMRMMVGNEPVTVHVIADEMPATRHMANGKMYTSKKKFRNETKARGCIEVGNEVSVKQRKYQYPDRRKRRDDIKRAWWEVENGQSQSLYELRNGIGRDKD